MTLPAMTWAQANNSLLATARGFGALGMTASTIRRWAHEDRISAVGKAPGGAHLYSIREVSEVSEKLASRRLSKGACK